MPPDAGIGVVITFEVALIVRIIPEVQGHARHWLSTNQLADFVCKRLASFIERVNSGPKYPTLHFTEVDWQDRHSPNEWPRQVSAS
ncbi:hypothetical protein D3C76_1165370 [compost metagenome]